MSDLKTFINSELAKRRRQYLESPALILEHYNIEQQNIDAYNGRQLLEMLQNADDAAETARVKKVLVRLKDQELTIANNGAPFDQGGLESILYSSLSPKSMQQRKIGQKGLGFRSILNWAEHVTIRSGGMTIGFSPGYAYAFLVDLMQADPTLASFLKQKSKAPFPIATLRVPRVLEHLELPATEDFDTTISIRLKPDVAPAVQEQINSIIGLPTLVFLHNLYEIDIESPERNVVFQKLRQGETVSVFCTNRHTNATESKTWKVCGRTGEHKGKAYEIEIAWTPDLSDTENCLYAWFKTQVRFPFPALLHGSFELTQDRNQLVDDTEGHNRFLCGEMAALLTETAEKIAESRPTDPWLPLHLLNVNHMRIDDNLQRFGFEKLMREKIKKSNVFPTVNKQFITHEKRPVFYEQPIAELLTGELVWNLMPVCKDPRLISFITNLGNWFYVIGNFVKIIITHRSKLNFEDQAKLIHHLLTYPEYQKETDETIYHQPFLTDDTGRAVSPGQHIFILPEGQDRHYVLPDELEIYFLHPELARNLATLFSVDLEGLPNKLGKLKVQLYAFDTVTTMVVRYFNKKEENAETVQHLHEILYAIYGDEYQSLGRPPEASLRTGLAKVLNRRNEVSDACDLYIGKYYGHRLSEELFWFDDSLLLAKPEKMGILDKDQGRVRSYFRWLRVGSLPQGWVHELEREKPDFIAYTDYMVHCAKLGANLNGDYSTTKSLWKRSATVKVFKLEYLDDILQSINLPTLMQWIHADETLRRILEEDSETALPAYSGSTVVASMMIPFPGNNWRSISASQMKSYVRWKIANTAWLPAENGELVAPNTCCFSHTVGSELSPWINKPRIDEENLSDQLKIKPETLRHYLEIAGVHRDISTFSTQQIYNALFALPDQDPDGKVAGRFYRELVAQYKDTRLDTTHPAYRTFMEKGMVLCRREKRLEYVPVSEARYLSNRGQYGQSLTRQFPLLVLDSKKGARQVEKLFGVKPLERLRFGIHRPVQHPMQEDFEREIDQFKVLAYALRMDQDTESAIARSIRQTQLILVSEAETVYYRNEEQAGFAFEDYSFVWVQNGRNPQKFYLKVPADIMEMARLRGNPVFCESVAEIFSMLLEVEEYASTLKSTFACPTASQEDWLLSEMGTDEPVLIAQAAERLGMQREKRYLLWETFVKTIPGYSGIPQPIRTDAEMVAAIQKIPGLTAVHQQYFVRTDIYEDMESAEFLEYLYQAIRKTGADGERFTRNFADIDFSAYFRQCFTDLKALYKSEFSQHLFESLKAAGDIGRQETYFDQLQSYDLLRYEPRYGYLTEVEEAFRLRVKETFQIELNGAPSNFSYDSLFLEKLLAFQTAMGQELDQKLKSRKKVQAWLLFGHEQSLRALIEQEKNRLDEREKFKQRYGLSGNAQTEMAEIYTKLEEELKDRQFDIVYATETHSVPAGKSNGQPRFNLQPGGHRVVDFSGGNERQIGMIGETIAKRALEQEYGTENVFWVSENAFLAINKPDGEAGKGYDFRVIDKKGKERLVEVKVLSSPEEGFRMTQNEWQTALSEPDRYDIFLVIGLQTEHERLIYLKHFFKVGRKENLLQNDRFTVETDRFLVKFSLDMEKWKQD